MTWCASAGVRVKRPRPATLPPTAFLFTETMTSRTVSQEPPLKLPAIELPAVLRF